MRAGLAALFLPSLLPPHAPRACMHARHGVCRRMRRCGWPPALPVPLWAAAWRSQPLQPVRGSPTTSLACKELPAVQALPQTPCQLSVLRSPPPPPPPPQVLCQLPGRGAADGGRVPGAPRAPGGVGRGLLWGVRLWGRGGWLAPLPLASAHRCIHLSPWLPWAPQAAAAGPSALPWKDMGPAPSARLAGPSCRPLALSPAAACPGLRTLASTCAPLLRLADPLALPFLRPAECSLMH